MQQLECAVESVTPAERVVVFAERAGREDFLVVPTVHDLVDVAEHDVSGIHAQVAQQAELLEGPGAVLAVRQEGGAGRTVGFLRRLEYAAVPSLGSAAAGGHRGTPG